MASTHRLAASNLFCVTEWTAVAYTKGAAVKVYKNNESSRCIEHNQMTFFFSLSVIVGFDQQELIWHVLARKVWCIASANPLSKKT